MAQYECTVTIKAGPVHPRRSVALLNYPASYVNIEGAFAGLDDRYYLKSFDMWMDNHHRPQCYHGWNQGEHDGKYTNCYVFEYVEEKERPYGFLCRPKGPADPQYEMCVLVLHAQKKKWKTDDAELARAERMRTDPHVQAALKDPDLFKKGKGKHLW